MPEKEISLQALGLLVNIMSYPETWELHKTELYKRYAKNKRTSVSAAWDELVEANFIIECRVRDGKKWDYNYFVRLVPFTEEEKEQIRKEVEAQEAEAQKPDEDQNIDEAETPDETSDFWDVDFVHPKMSIPKSTANKKRSNKKRSCVVVKEIQEAFAHNFDGYDLKESTAKILLKKAAEADKDIFECIENTLLYHALKEEEIENPVGAIIHEIEVGWDIAALKAKKKKEAEAASLSGRTIDFTPYDWVNR